MPSSTRWPRASSRRDAVGSCFRSIDSGSRSPQHPVLNNRVMKLCSPTRRRSTNGSRERLRAGGGDVPRLRAQTTFVERAGATWSEPDFCIDFDRVAHDEPMVEEAAPPAEHLRLAVVGGTADKPSYTFARGSIRSWTLRRSSRPSSSSPAHEPRCLRRRVR